jgi:hypothetical protein
MVSLKEIQAALNAPGLVTAVPLSFNQLKIEIAKKLHIEVDDPVFNEHKQAIKDGYVKVYQKVCNEAVVASAPAKKPAAAPPKPAARAAPAKKPAKKRHDSESEEEESDASESGSESDESDKGGRKGSAFSSDPEVKRLTGIAKYATQAHSPCCSIQALFNVISDVLIDDAPFCPCLSIFCSIYIYCLSFIYAQEVRSQRGQSVLWRVFIP